MNTLRRSLCSAAMLVALGLVTLAAADQQWSQFRGPSAGVGVDDAALPYRWSATENVAWKVDVPGMGWSSPIVWGDHVFVTSVINTGTSEPPKPGLYFGGERPASTSPHRWMVYDFDFNTGKLRWEKEVRASAPAGPKHLKNSYASETPATDGERVYFYFGGVGLFVYDMNGTAVWSKPLGPFKTRYGWGTAASPVLHQDRVYIVNDNDEQSFLAAYDKRTGAEIWRVNRAEGTNWATPFVWQHAQRTEIVTSGTDRVRSYDLSGTPLWELKGMSSITIPTPFAAHGLLFLSSGYVGDALRPTYAIRPGASGDISLKAGETSNAFIAWSAPTLAPYNPTPLVYGDYYYTLLDRGFFMCHDAKTGKEIYGRQRIAADAGGFTTSPFAYNDRIFVTSEEGDTYVIQAGPRFEVIAKNSLGEMTLASPAISRGSLVIRTASKLYRITSLRIV
jgi:outer membrane protein assembly factor BamB